MVVAEYYIEDIVRATKLKKEQIVEGLTNIGAPSVESEDRQKLIVELTPNRVDLLHPIGVVRALLAFYGKRKPRTYETQKGRTSYEVLVDRSVAKIRPYTACAVARGVDLGGHNLDYLIQFQEKLHATLGRNVKKMGMGFYPLETLAFPIQYTTRKPEEIVYQPLNYPKATNAREILEKHPKGREYGGIIASHERYPVFLDANGEVLCLIPICNSEKFGKVNAQTTDIFIEVTGNDLNTNLATLGILACAFIDSGATMYRVKMKYPDQTLTTPQLQPRKTKLDLGFANRLLGSMFGASEAKRLLARMDIGLESSYAVTPPYRVDIMHAVDIVEDLAIAYGYNRFERTLPNFFSEGKRNERHASVHQIMQNMGFQEVRSFVLTRPQLVERYGGVIQTRVTNPVSEEFGTLRTTLLPGLLEIFRLNRVKGLPQRIYEIGEVSGRAQENRLVLGIMDQENTFVSLRGCLQTLARVNGWQLKLKEAVMPAWLETPCAGEIWINGSRRGLIGRINGEYARQLGIEFEVCVAELVLGE